MELKVNLVNGHIIWDVNSKCRKIVEPMAARFGMSVEEFLKKKSRSELPGQPDAEPSIEDLDRGDGFKVTPCDSTPLWKRVERAARFSKKEINEFIWVSLISTVECCEDDMIVCPVNGEPIGDDLLIEQFRVRQIRREFRAEAA